jgi:hypothetical protein
MVAAATPTRRTPNDTALLSPVRRWIAASDCGRAWERQVRLGSCEGTRACGCLPSHPDPAHSVKVGRSSDSQADPERPHKVG